MDQPDKLPMVACRLSWALGFTFAISSKGVGFLNNTEEKLPKSTEVETSIPDSLLRTRYLRVLNRGKGRYIAVRYNARNLSVPRGEALDILNETSSSDLLLLETLMVPGILSNAQGSLTIQGWGV